jgi:hypothetical protein
MKSNERKKERKSGVNMAKLVAGFESWFGQIQNLKNGKRGSSFLVLFVHSGI